MIIVANKKVIIRDTDNPFDHGEIPYSEAKDYPLDKEFYAISDVDLLCPLQDKINDITNLRLDNIFNIINNMYIAQKEQGIKSDDFISRPNGIIWSDDVNAVKPLLQPDVSASSFKEAEETYRVMQQVSGAWEYAQGATPQRQETATGIVRLQQAALKRFGYRIKLLQRTGFKDILTKQMQMNQQLLPLNYPLKVFNKNMDIRLNPWDIAGKFSLNASGSANLIMLEERMIQFYAEAKDDPFFNQPELRKRFMDIFDFPNSEELINKTTGLLGIAQGGGQPQLTDQSGGGIESIVQQLSGALA